MISRFGPVDLPIRTSPLSDFHARVEPFVARLHGGEEVAEQLARVARAYVDGQRWLMRKSSRTDARRALERLRRPCKTLLTTLRQQNDETRERIGQLLFTFDSLKQRYVSMSDFGRDLEDLAETSPLAAFTEGPKGRPGFRHRLTDLGQRLASLPLDSEWQFLVMQDKTPLLDPKWPAKDVLEQLLKRILVIAEAGARNVTRRGPVSNTMLMRTVQSLAELWCHSGQIPTHSDTLRGEHTGNPRSPFGVFAADFFSAIEPDTHKRSIIGALEHVVWPSRRA